MVSLFTGFLSGAVNQLNANFDANKKRQEERDKRREEMADQLGLYMKKGDYDKINKREEFDYERTAKNEDTIAAEGRGLEIYKQQKGIDVGASKEIDSFRTDQNIRQQRAEADLKATNAKKLSDEINTRFGGIKGGLGKPSSDAESTENLYKKQAAYEGLQADPELAPFGRAGADMTNTEIKLSERKNQYKDKPLEFPGRNPYEAMSERLKANKQMDSDEYSIYFPEKAKVYAGNNAEHSRSVAEQQLIADAIGRKTLVKNESLGVDSNNSRIPGGVVEDTSFAVARAKNILMASVSSPEEKKKAVDTIDLALKFTGVKAEDLTSDPSLKVVFDNNFRSVYNQYADTPTATSDTASAAPTATPVESGVIKVSTPEDFTKVPKGTKYQAPDGSIRIKQ